MNNLKNLHASKVMLKILQARLQQYMNQESSDVQAGFRKGRETRDQNANIHWIIEKTREFQRYIYFCFIDYAKAFNCVHHNKLWKILKEMGILDHLPRLLRNLYAGQETTGRTGHGTNHNQIVERERQTENLENSKKEVTYHIQVSPVRLTANFSSEPIKSQWKWHINSVQRTTVNQEFYTQPNYPSKLEKLGHFLMNKS